MHIIDLTLHCQFTLLRHLDGLLHWTDRPLREAWLGRVCRLDLVPEHRSQVSDLPAQLLNLNLFLLILDVVQLAELVIKEVVLPLPLGQLLILLVDRGL